MLLLGFIGPFTELTSEGSNIRVTLRMLLDIRYGFKRLATRCAGVGSQVSIVQALDVVV